VHGGGYPTQGYCRTARSTAGISLTSSASIYTVIFVFHQLSVTERAHDSDVTCNCYFQILRDDPDISFCHSGQVSIISKTSRLWTPTPCSSQPFVIMSPSLSRLNIIPIIPPILCPRIIRIPHRPKLSIIRHRQRPHPLLRQPPKRHHHNNHGDNTIQRRGNPLVLLLVRSV
jgi:hypothetical protein